MVREMVCDRIKIAASDSSCDASAAAIRYLLFDSYILVLPGAMVGIPMDWHARLVAVGLIVVG